jgi:hypothetical protein
LQREAFIPGEEKKNLRGQIEMFEREIEASKNTGGAVIPVEIGDVCCAIECADEALGNLLRDWYGNFFSRRAPDFTVRLSVVDGKSAPELKTALTEMRLKQDGQRCAADNVALETEFDEANRTLQLRVERSFFDAGADFKLMNRVLPLVYYTVSNWKHDIRSVPILVHSSAVVRRGKALMFTGPSETGKTTAARLGSGDWADVLNDEMNLVSRYRSSGEPVTARGVPILGGLPQRRNATAPLSCVFALKQGKETRVRPLNRVEAYLRFIRQVISPAFLGQTDRQALFSLMADFADEVTGTVPFYELEFSLDETRFRNVLEAVENSLEKEEVKSGKLAGQD